MAFKVGTKCLEVSGRRERGVFISNIWVVHLSGPLQTARVDTWPASWCGSWRCSAPCWGWWRRRSRCPPRTGSCWRRTSCWGWRSLDRRARRDFTVRRAEVLNHQVIIIPSIKSAACSAREYSATSPPPKKSNKSPNLRRWNRKILVKKKKCWLSNIFAIYVFFGRSD